jgi:hypothetical protein
MSTVTVAPRDVSGPYPIPPGRGRWRLTLHARTFVGGGYGNAGAAWGTTLVGVLAHARSRRLETSWNKPSALSFTVDGRDPIAAQILELRVDVIAWRWDDYAGADVQMFRGVVDAGEDELSADSHVVIFTAHDYGAMLERRRITGTLPWNQNNVTQDAIVEAALQTWGMPAAFLPGSWMPLHVVMVNPDGTPRAAAVQPRVRLYQPGMQLSALVDELSAVLNGFDYDVCPADRAAGRGYSGPTAGPLPANVDALRIWYPQRGTVRTDVALVYGGNIGAATRTLTSSQYANRVFGLGNNGSTDPNAAKLISDQSNPDASAAVVGLWDDGLNASDVSVQSSLDAQASGQLAYEGTIVPSYTLTVRPGRYRYDYPRIGDVCPVLIRSGRLSVEDDQRVMAINYGIGDDGDETVELTVGRAPTTFGGLFRATRRDIAALNRR